MSILDIFSPQKGLRCHLAIILFDQAGPYTSLETFKSEIHPLFSIYIGEVKRCFVYSLYVYH